MMEEDAILLFLLLIAAATAAPHVDYPSFSAPEHAILNQNTLSVSDDAIYEQAWYASDGDATWTPFTLQGTSIEPGSPWLTGQATATPPTLGSGEHYVITYSCTQAQGAWDCHGNDAHPDGYWQLLVLRDEEEPLPSCEESCDEGFTCQQGVCEVSSGSLYYVATDGYDENRGSIDEPWGTLQHAVLMAEPGDVVYIRGGVYHPPDSVIWDVSSGVGKSGTSQAPIRFLNYPGERPVFDFENNDLTDSYYNFGFELAGVEHVHLRGMTIRNLYQHPIDAESDRFYQAGGINCSPCANMRYENMAVHDIDGRAFQHWTGAWNDFDAQEALERCQTERAADPDLDPATCTYSTPVFPSDNTHFINNDAYNLYDRYSPQPGNAADGWKVETYLGTTFTWEGNRAWNYSDDGFDPHGSGTRIFRQNWAMATDKYEGIEGWDVEGNGLKTTGIHNNDTPDSLRSIIYDRNIVARSGGAGFITNLGINYDPEHTYPSNADIYNNLAYHTDIGYSEYWYPDTYGTDAVRTSHYHNNIAFNSTSEQGELDPVYEVTIMNPSIYEESHNTWVGTGDHSWPGWEYNPSYDVTAQDFVSLDTSQLANPRRSDHTLPDITFGHLAAGSELIDGGTLIAGYHCAQTGPHPGDDCVEWYGDAPDLGPFETGKTQETICEGPSIRPCLTTQGRGQQYRTCTGPGTWSTWSSCTFVACEEGYELQGGQCALSTGWSPELLSNGGFESGVAGWTTNSDTWSVGHYLASGTGHAAKEGYYAAYNTDAPDDTGYIYQDANLNPYAEAIDAGGVVANASGWGITNAAMHPYVKTRIRYEFLDSNKQVISTPLDTGYILSQEWWEAAVREEPVPQGTRYLRVWGNTYETLGYLYTSGDLDGFTVRISVPEEPCPSCGEASTPTGAIIADHEAVTGFDLIPESCIERVRSMFFVYPGESHGMGVQEGLDLLERDNPELLFSLTSNPLSNPLPAGSFAISRYLGSSNWNGEDKIWAAPSAVEDITAYLQALKEAGRAPDAFGWGWCWDMTNGGNVGGSMDETYGVRWAGRSVGSPTGSGRWGLDAGDQTLTGNDVSLQTYLDAFASIQTAHPDVVVIYQTGPVDEQENRGESGYQRYLKHERIRQYVRDNDLYLFDYADILTHNDAGTIAQDSWNGHTFPVIHDDNDPDYAAHISEAGVRRLAKANWWLMARIAGWDGTASGTCP